MRVEKIELIGFKSFADRTIFTLHPGITCIVGPNGCGKSNIVDAFRWVLGEQSAKSLRGEKMEEVIFNGSSQKKPKGMAEVTMLVSGLNGGTHGNGQSSSDHTTVTRRLYRSGESEYMINRSPCRLKDVKDIFLDTGLDFRSYSILEQGRIGEIINSKPYERRFIIEEVAGVMKYKVRKAEALSKLESSRANLLRINDIIVEIKKQIGILDRLAKKAERYKRLSAELHAIELKLSRREYQILTESLFRILEEYNSLKEKEAFLAGRISDSENRTEARRLDLIEREKALEGVQTRYQALEREISEADRTIAVGKNDVSNLRDYVEKLIAQEAEVETRSREMWARGEELRRNEESLTEEIETLAETLREQTQGFGEIEEQLAEIEEEIEERRRRIFSISEELSGARNELSRQESASETLEKKEALAARESEEARKMLEQIEQSIAAAESEILGSSNETLLLEEKKEKLLQELSMGKARYQALQEALGREREDLASLSSRLGSLKEIVLDSPTRELITSTARVRVLDTLSDVLEVPAEYEKAVEAGLSEKVDSFIMESQEDIEQSVALLKGADVGKTSFIQLKPTVTVKEGAIPEGIIGRALDLVRVKEGYSAVAENMLHDMMIVSDLRAAFEKRYADGRYRYVTLDGEVIEPCGAVLAGEGKGIFGRKREVRELEETIVSRKDAIGKIAEEIEDVQRVVREKDEEIDSVQSSIHKFEREISISRLTVDNLIEEKERISRKLSYLTLEIDETSKEREILKATLSASGDIIREIESRKTRQEEDARLLLEGISQKKSEREAYRARVTDLKLSMTSKKERLEAVRNEIGASAKVLKDLEQKTVELGEERASVLSRIRGREEEITAQETALRALVADADVVRLDISKRKDEIEAENADLISVEQGLKALRQEMGAITSKVSELDVSRTEHRMKIDNLVENVRTNYGRDLADVSLEEVTEDEEDRLVELRARLQEIGPVNLGTLEEYEELKTRYEFMTKQQDDLTKSIAELEEAITKINSTTRKKLREAFAAINEKFREVFVTLFGGGKAELVLTDEQNILESGIEIIVQPPGKRLQNIHLLSGGEKALTALAIQFSSFLIKPTPLCILDEADAPLDESNTERYSRMLEELSRETQFIVVTHNRTTMSVARNLYGITMEEAGVSKVLSMQLAEA